jgi:hypothetical protein
MLSTEDDADMMYSFLSRACEGKEPTGKLEEFLSTRTGRFYRLHSYEEKICKHCKGGLAPGRKFRDVFEISDIETGWCCSSKGQWFCASVARTDEMACPYS